MDVEFYVKISVSKRPYHIVDDVVYYRRYMSLNFVIRWQWYFEERIKNLENGVIDFYVPGDYVNKVKLYCYE